VDRCYRATKRCVSEPLDPLVDSVIRNGLGVMNLKHNVLVWKGMWMRTLKSTSKVYDRYPDLNINFGMPVLGKLTSTMHRIEARLPLVWGYVHPLLDIVLTVDAKAYLWNRLFRKTVYADRFTLDTLRSLSSQDYFSKGEW
jgi:hypothetical protein